jgi:hypothetical protein
MNPRLTIGFEGPVTRSSHQGISTAWFSMASISFSVAAIWTDARQPTGEPAKWIAV